VPILVGGLRHDVSMHFEDWMDLVVKAFEVVGVAILGLGSLAALIGAGLALMRGDQRGAYASARRAPFLGIAPRSPRRRT